MWFAFIWFESWENKAEWKFLRNCWSLQYWIQQIKKSVQKYVQKYFITISSFKTNMILFIIKSEMGKCWWCKVTATNSSNYLLHVLMFQDKKNHSRLLHNGIKTCALHSYIVLDSIPTFMSYPDFFFEHTLSRNCCDWSCILKWLENNLNALCFILST